jgi:hypothetical protein
MVDDHRGIITEAVYVTAVGDGRIGVSRARLFVAGLVAVVAVALAVAAVSLVGGAGHRRHRVRALVAVPIVTTPLAGWREVNRANSVRVARQMRKQDRDANDRPGR